MRQSNIQTMWITLKAFAAGTATCLAMCCLFRPDASATPSFNANPLLVSSWTTEDGLPQSSVITMIQGRNGYLWLGTMKGLARFDGETFTRFDETTVPELGNSPVVLLLQDSRGDLWVGTRDDGVVLIRAGQAIPLPIGPETGDGHLLSATEDEQGGIWLYTAAGRLYRYLSGQMAPPIPMGTGRPSQCRSVIADKSGRVWAGMDWQQVGLGMVDTNGLFRAVIEEVVSLEQLDYLLACESKGYWRLANGRVQKRDDLQLIKDFGVYPWEDPLITAACEDPNGNLIVGTSRSGVFWYDAEGQVQRLTGLSNDRILSLCFDHEGDLWVGTDGGGLNRVKRSQFSTLPGTGDWVVQSAADDAEGGVWIGCNGGELAHWADGALKHYRTSLELPSIKSVAVEREQKVWVGTWGLGLFELAGDEFKSPDFAVRLSQSAVTAIHEDHFGALWLGVQRTSLSTHDGLARIKDRRLSFLTSDDGLAPGAVRALIDDAEGNLWIGTSGGGLNRYREGKFTSYRRASGKLPSDDISALHLDSDGVLWIGTDGGGLARLHEGRWTTYSKRNGLASNSIGYLLEDDAGYLWLGSDAGLMRISKSALNSYALGQTNALPCRTYGQADGLPTRECTFGSQPAACATPDGRLWFPTTRGLVTVDPVKLTPNPVPPLVAIESIRIDQQEQLTNTLSTTWPKRITLVPGNQSLEVAYTSLNLSARDRTRFRYRLEGYDSGWNEAGAGRTARYQLPPGDYNFRVSAANEDGMWSTQDATFAVIVLPPFWRTPWFLALTAAISIGLIAGSVYYISTQRLQNQLARLRQKEALEKERARIARDLHDQLGANLTQISLLGEMAEADKDLPEEIEDHAKQICITSRETTRALDEIVWAANPSNDTLDGLINYVCKYAQEYLALAGLRYRLEVPHSLPNLNLQPELRHNVFLAAKEAVNNVVKHAQASEARLSLKLNDTHFTLEIADNGRGPKGTETTAARSRNGLRNMRKRMGDIGGQFLIDPAPGGGTVVRLTAPLSKI